MAVNAVIFDIDGTLVDSVDLHARAWQEAFQHFGYKISFEKIRHEIGKGSDKLIPDLLGAEESKRVHEQLDQFRGELWKSKYLARGSHFRESANSLSAFCATESRLCWLRRLRAMN